MAANTHTVLVQVTLTIEVDVEATSAEEAARLAKTFKLEDEYVTGHVVTATGTATQWCDFDQTTKVVRTA